MDSNNDADYGHGEFSSHKYTPEQLKSMATDIFETWTRQGVHPEEARQEAEEFYIRHAEKANRAAAGGAPRPSRSSRPSAFDDFSGMGDALDNEDDYRNHSSRSSHFASKRGKSSSCTNRSPGWEDPIFDEIFTEEPRSFRTKSYYDDEEGIPRSQRRRERSGSGRSHRGHRSHSSAYDNNYTDTEPPRSSRGTGAHGYYTEERRPGGFSYTSYFTSGPETRHQSHSSYSQHRDSRDDRPPPRHSRAPETSGVKPTEDPYVTLGISSSASISEIKKAHRNLSLENHPDRVAGGSAAKKRATERMAMINQAHDVLKDKEMRAFYDRTGLIASTI
ncbi:hypothetical protein N0V94_003210 [Neodidymelliopsis sp. IMI 364377]|nr:hypothetical protein N0V94_003210 [Neodidymelliopsis sp. IMI 364377]